MPNFDRCVLDDADSQAQVAAIKELAAESGTKIAPTFNQFCVLHRTNHFIEVPDVAHGEIKSLGGM